MFHVPGIGLGAMWAAEKRIAIRMIARDAANMTMGLWTNHGCGATIVFFIIPKVPIIAILSQVWEALNLSPVLPSALRNRTPVP
jgi:hypothetical protein